MTPAARWRWGVIAACAVALAVRLAATIAFQGLGAPPDRVTDPDQVDYEATGWALASGHGFSIAGQPTWFRPPGTSFTIAAVYAALGRRSWAGLRVAFALLSALTCAVVALAGRRAWGAASGLVAAWALALDPAHLHYAMHFVSEVPYALLVAAAVWAGLETLARARGGRRGAALAASAACSGALLGAAALVRPQAVLVLPLALLLPATAPRAWRRRATVATAVAVAAAALIVGGWVTRNGLRFGHWSVASVGASTLYGGNNAQVLADPALCGSWASQRGALGAPALPRDEALYAARSAAAARAFLRRHWRDLPRLEACKAARLVSPLLATPDRRVQLAFAAAWLLVAPLAAVGVLAAWRRDAAATLVVLLPLVALLLTALVFYGSIRFRHSSEPLIVLLAAEGALVTWARLVRPARRAPTIVAQQTSAATADALDAPAGEP